MSLLVRIDPKNSSNCVVKQNNFIRSARLNRQLEIDCEIGMADRKNTEPLFGYWLSKLTLDGTSCVWRDFVHSTIEYSGNKLESDLEDFDIGYIRDWINTRKITYKLKSDANLFDAVDAKMMLKYKIQAPATTYLLEKERTCNDNLELIHNFIESNKLDIDIKDVDKSLKGVNAVFDDNKLVKLSRSKSGSKIDMIRSCNYLLKKLETEQEYINKCKNERFTIDWDQIRQDGWDGIIFNNYYKNVDENDDNDIAEMKYFLDRWTPDTVIVWNWCFEDDMDVSYFDDTEFIDSLVLKDMINALIL